MGRFSLLLPLFFAARFGYGQMLLVDLAPALSADSPSHVELKRSGFIGGDFRAGASGETWILDTIRTWAAATDRPLSVVLFGGIESAAAAAPAGFECDCHNLVALKRSAGSSADVLLTPAAPGIWQVEFRHLRWSVPGGVPIQFGVRGVDPIVVLAAAGSHSLRVFDENGKLLGPYDGLTSAGGAVTLPVQAWGHLLASVNVRRVGPEIEVTLESSATFDAAKSDPGSLRFGPKEAHPVAVSIAPGRQGSNLVARFRASDTGIGPADVSVCLSGRSANGAPFEGCDLVPKIR